MNGTDGLIRLSRLPSAWYHPADGSISQGRARLLPHQVQQVQIRVATSGLSLTEQLRFIGAESVTVTIHRSILVTHSTQLSAEAAQALDTFLAGVVTAGASIPAAQGLNPDQQLVAAARTAAYTRRWQPAHPEAVRQTLSKFHRLDSLLRTSDSDQPDRHPYQVKEDQKADDARLSRAEAAGHGEHPEAIEERQRSDAASAAEFLAAHPSRHVTLDKALRWMLLVFATAGVGFATAVLRTEEDRWTALAVVSLAAAVLAYGSRQLLADQWIRRQRRLAHQWLATRDPGQLQRGLPPVFLAAWQRPPTTLLRGGETCGWVLAPFLLLAGIVLFTETERFTLIAPLVLLLVGAGSVLWALRCGARRRQLQRQTITEFARLSGTRTDQ
ncbi:hypothetical protein [Nesterenkonia alkaliphila]|uniref:Uncharacterized protein n=1 Tax=Nesterenkonia alkaliphila TaxID=1463631 RepID=A0A7K1ULM6_9MICC|nr:hypothetical protein [Nesterenkonia alkaliphila]MVT27232.1 hypothetical protein [Nesterenkonia alkaliphila]GFZ78408.1 hypothetical protein GCM10011359_03370 [Nesterenkonia alkaliphila]